MARKVQSSPFGISAWIETQAMLRHNRPTKGASRDRAGKCGLQLWWGGVVVRHLTKASARIFSFSHRAIRFGKDNFDEAVLRCASADCRPRAAVRTGCANADAG